MKRLIFAATLLAGGAAIAQQPMTAPVDPANPMTADEQTMPAPEMSPAVPDTSMEPMPATPPTGATMPHASAPMGDPSAPPAEPAWQPGIGGPEDEAISQRLDTYQPVQRDDYPTCSASVTDNCVQRNDPGGNRRLTRA